MMSSSWKSLFGFLLLITKAQCGTYLNPSSGFFVAPYTIQDSGASHGYLKSMFYDIPDILKCLPRFIAGKISSGTESIVLSMTQPVNYVIDVKMIEEGFSKCLGEVGVSTSDAAEVFMRKLGNKIIKEEDWRIAGKSLFIMHQILTSTAINGEVVRELAESYLDRFGLLASAVQGRISRNQGDKPALLWVQQYLEYLRSLSEVIRRRSGGREVQDFRSLLRLSSGYCASAARLLASSAVGARFDDAALTSSKAFFVQLSSSSNALVKVDVRAHSGSLTSLQTSSSNSCSLQQESLSEIQRHAKDIRDAISYVLEQSPIACPISSESSARITRSSSAKSSGRHSGIGKGNLFHSNKADTSTVSTKASWLESLAEMQCELRRVHTDTFESVAQDSSTSNININSNSMRSSSVSNRKRNRIAVPA